MQRMHQGVAAPIEPFRTGTLDVGDGHRLYWEECGDPIGKAAVVLHGGPGSGCAPWQRRLFDPSAYRIVLFDQRNCGRSTPHASEPDVDLSANTTLHLLEDTERLRSHLGIDRWLVLGGSWGSLLALAYAERHPDRVSELVVFGVATGRRSEDDWLFRGGVGAFFPQQWERLVRAVPPDRWRDDVVQTYANLLFHADSDVRSRAAFEWCLWESATPAWPPSTGLDRPRRAFPRPGVRACVRQDRHALRPARRVDRGRGPPSEGGPDRRNSGRDRERAVRLPVAAGLGVGAASRVAARGARCRRGRGSRRECERNQGRARRGDRRVRVALTDRLGDLLSEWVGEMMLARAASR